ncbi:MAG: SRPBCC family protein [Thermoanaerobaculia bacterium]|nr:SRPBCC family protein [Thermoanaerobaculia bacterium]
MTEISLSRTIAAPRNEVFARLSDFPKAAETISAITRIEMLTEGDVGVGTRFKETRKVFGREATEEMEVTRFDPPRSYTLEAESHGAHYVSTFTLEETSDGTEVELVFRATPLTLLAKFMSFLTKPMMRKAMQECAKDLEDVARSFEAG